MAHIHTIKIRGFHCDLYQHVNNARYLEFLEEARWEYVAEVPDLAKMGDHGLGFIIAAINIEYKRPVGLGDVVEIRSQMVDFAAKRAVMQQQVFNLGNGKLVADARVSFAVIDLATGRAVPMAGEVRSWFEPKDASGDPA